VTRCLLVICHRRLGYTIWDHPEGIGNQLSRNVGDYQLIQRHSPEDVSVHQQHYKSIKRRSFALWFFCVHTLPPFQGLTLIPVLSHGTGWEDEVS